MAGLDQLGVNATLQEPDAEPREPSEGAAGKWGAIGGADPLRQAILLEEPGEHGPDEPAGRLQQGLAAEEIAAVVVGQRQRIAVPPVARAEVPLEVQGPERIGGGRDGRRAAGMRQGSPAVPAADEAPALQPQPGGARGRPPPRRVAATQELVPARSAFYFKLET